MNSRLKYIDPEIIERFNGDEVKVAEFITGQTFDDEPEHFDDDDDDDDIYNCTLKLRKYDCRPMTLGVMRTLEKLANRPSFKKFLRDNLSEEDAEVLAGIYVFILTAEPREIRKAITDESIYDKAVDVGFELSLTEQIQVGEYVQRFHRRVQSLSGPSQGGAGNAPFRRNGRNGGSHSRTNSAQRTTGRKKKRRGKNRSRGR